MSNYPLMEKVVSEGSNKITKLYIYGPTGFIAMNNDDGWFFMIKDHLGSTRTVLNESNTKFNFLSTLKTHT
ncbi:MAG: hypothetical protein CR986_03930 [Ignavibacteriae bacterium]|nr:MAG: hypothetical protein CR986_03930 [Ignavibacteriota bacterium]